MRAVAPEPVLHGSTTRLNGEREGLDRYRGKVVLVVNTASQCGFTPQFGGLEKLYRERRGDGLVVLGFPSNDFAGQEPRSDAEIATFCRQNFGVTFPMFGRTPVTGDAAHPLYRRLAARFGAGTEPGDAELVERLDALL